MAAWLMGTVPPLYLHFLGPRFQFFSEVSTPMAVGVGDSREMLFWVGYYRTARISTSTYYKHGNTVLLSDVGLRCGSAGIFQQT